MIPSSIGTKLPEAQQMLETEIQHKIDDITDAPEVDIFSCGNCQSFFTNLDAFVYHKVNKVCQPEDNQKSKNRGVIDDAVDREVLSLEMCDCNPLEPFVVEKIENKRFNPKINQLEYYVKWSGFSQDENTWQRESTLNDARSQINQYERQLCEGFIRASSQSNCRATELADQDSLAQENEKEEEAGEKCDQRRESQPLQGKQHSSNNIDEVIGSPFINRQRKNLTNETRVLSERDKVYLNHWKTRFEPKLTRKPPKTLENRYVVPNSKRPVSLEFETTLRKIRDIQLAPTNSSHSVKDRIPVYVSLQSTIREIHKIQSISPSISSAANDAFPENMSFESTIRKLHDIQSKATIVSSAVKDRVPTSESTICKTDDAQSTICKTDDAQSTPTIVSCAVTDLVPANISRKSTICEIGDAQSNQTKVSPIIKDHIQGDIVSSVKPDGRPFHSSNHTGVPIRIPRFSMMPINEATFRKAFQLLDETSSVDPNESSSFSNKKLSESQNASESVVFPELVKNQFIEIDSLCIEEEIETTEIAFSGMDLAEEPLQTCDDTNRVRKMSRDDSGMFRVMRCGETSRPKTSRDGTRVNRTSNCDSGMLRVIRCGETTHPKTSRDDTRVNRTSNCDGGMIRVIRCDETTRPKTSCDGTRVNKTSNCDSGMLRVIRCDETSRPKTSCDGTRVNKTLNCDSGMIRVIRCGETSRPKTSRDGTRVKRTSNCESGLYRVSNEIEPPLKPSRDTNYLERTMFGDDKSSQCTKSTEPLLMTSFDNKPVNKTINNNIELSNIIKLINTTPIVSSRIYEPAKPPLGSSLEANQVKKISNDNGEFSRIFERVNSTILSSSFNTIQKSTICAYDKLSRFNNRIEKPLGRFFDADKVKRTPYGQCELPPIIEQVETSPLKPSLVIEDVRRETFPNHIPTGTTPSKTPSKYEENMSIQYQCGPFKKRRLYVDTGLSENKETGNTSSFDIRPTLLPISPLKEDEKCLSVSNDEPKTSSSSVLFSELTSNGDDFQSSTKKDDCLLPPSDDLISSADNVADVQIEDDAISHIIPKLRIKYLRVLESQDSSSQQHHPDKPEATTTQEKTALSGSISPTTVLDDDSSFENLPWGHYDVHLTDSRGNVFLIENATIKDDVLYIGKKELLPSANKSKAGTSKKPKPKRKRRKLRKLRKKRS